MEKRCIWTLGLAAVLSMAVVPRACRADSDYSSMGADYRSFDGEWYIETQAAINEPGPGSGFAYGGNIIAQCYVDHQSRHYFYVYTDPWSAQHEYTWNASFQAYPTSGGGQGSVAIGYSDDYGWYPYLPSDSLSPYIPSDSPAPLTVAAPGGYWTSDAYSKLVDNAPAGQEAGGAVQADHTHNWYCSECGQGCPL